MRKFGGEVVVGEVVIGRVVRGVEWMDEWVCWGELEGGGVVWRIFLLLLVRILL